MAAHAAKEATMAATDVAAAGKRGPYVCTKCVFDCGKVEHDIAFYWHFLELQALVQMPYLKQKN
jgi:hypothetical protein